MKLAALPAGLAALATIAGCHLAPPAVELRTSHALREEPHRAAVCVARNLDRHPAGFDSRIREGTAPALIEVRVTLTQPVALAEFLVRDSGATAVVTTTAALGIDRAGFVAAILAGC